MWFGQKRIYLDYAGATPLRSEALQAMRQAETLFGNPGALHADATAAKRSLEHSRECIAVQLAVKSREIVFTSGLTESNNLAILGFARKLVLSQKDLSKTHWIVNSIEHSSILECFTEIERLGGQVSFVDPDARGRIVPDVLARALRKETVFVSIGWANAEIGVLQPLSQLSRVIREHEKHAEASIAFHSDAGQAPLYIAPIAHTLGVDLLSIGSGKLYGPRGIGALYVGARAEVASILLGGGQERGLRSGTEDVALAAGFAEALSLAASERKDERERLEKMRVAFADLLKKGIDGLVVNGDETSKGNHALPHVLNVSVPGVQSEYLLLSLDQAGLSLSTKSACSEGSSRVSHVVARIISAEHDKPKDAWRAESTLRFSFGKETSDSDMRRAAKLVIETYVRARKNNEIGAA